MTALRYFDDFRFGESFMTGWAQVRTDEAIAFAEAYDPQGFHVDELEAAQHTLFRGPSASAHVWTAAVDETRGDEYEQFAREISLPMFQKQDGYEGAIMLRSGTDCIVLTLWSDERRAQQLRSSLSYAEPVRQIRDRGLLVGEQSIKVFAMHLMDLTQKHPE